MSDGGQVAGRIGRGPGFLALAGLVALLPLPACAANGTPDAAAAATPPLVAPAAAPVPPPLPASLPADRDPGWGGLLNQRADPRTAPYGAGRLGPADPAATYGVDWARGIVLPIFDAPGGAQRGWLARGWWIPVGDKPRPMPLDCLLETDYETASFVLYEIRDDGWLRLGVEAPCDGGGAWVHRGHLGLGSQALAVQTWAERFLLRDSPMLYVRAPGRHALRAEPTAEAALVAWIGESASLEPLEIRGEWLRARVSEPSAACREPGEWKGVRHEGWLRWTSPERGPWVWYPTRGC